MGRCPAFGECISGIVTVVPLTTFGELCGAVLQHRLTLEQLQRDDLHRGGADLAQLVGDGFHAGFATDIVVRPQQHVATFERCQVGFVPGVGTVRPAGGHVARQQFGGGIGSFLAFAENNRCVNALGQFIKAQ
ncbi:hypothetical protein D3C84_750950 [compost metagenome]